MDYLKLTSAMMLALTSPILSPLLVGANPQNPESVEIAQLNFQQPPPPPDPPPGTVTGTGSPSGTGRLSHSSLWPRIRHQFNSPNSRRRLGENSF